MLVSLFGNAYLAMAVAVFIAVALLLEGLYLLWASHRGPRARKIGKRIVNFTANARPDVHANLLKQRLMSDLPFLERVLLAMPRAHKLERLLRQAGLSWKVSRLLLTSAGLTLGMLFAVGGIARQGWILTLAAGLTGGALPWWYVLRQRTRRLRTIEHQLPEALDLITRALRSGHAFSSGLHMVGDEMPEPIAAEFRAVHDEVNYGTSLAQALNNLTERVPSTDLRYFVVSVLIQRESGGNLTEVLGNLANLIRERLKLMARVRVLTADGRLSAWVLGVLPFALAAVMNLVNPAFMSPMWTDPLGIAITKYTLIMMAIGALILRRLVRLRY